MQLNCILLVDDNDDDNFFHSRVLKKSGVVNQIEVVRDALEAIEYIKRLELGDPNTPIPDLIFLDINMPKMNGWEFLEEYKTFLPHIRDRIKIVMLTTSINPDDKTKAEDNKIVLDLIHKPLTDSSIKSLIYSLFKRGS